MKFYWPIEFEILDDWWSDAGMVDFAPAALAYNAMPPPYPSEAMLPDDIPSVLVLLRDIKPIDRNLKGIVGVRLFASKERLVRILTGIRENIQLPPIQVVEDEEDGHVYRLCHGVHRFYASVAAGFTHIPAVIG
jgi:hypothetical protein